METINSVTNAATRAIWGDSNTNKTDSGSETLSGETGNTKGGEPYDAGNTGASVFPASQRLPTRLMININELNSTSTERTTLDSKDTKRTTLDSNDTEKTSATGNASATDSGISSNSVKQTNVAGNTAATGPIRPEHDTDKTGVTSLNKPSNAFGSDRPSNANDTSGQGPVPSVSADPESAAQNTQKHQGADRPHEEPEGDEHDRIKETKAEAERSQEVDTSGPGPKPLSETHKSGAAASSSSGGDDDGPQKHSDGTGTGEQYVKSSGLKADGGDFDASNPGAGKEADRLLESKGVHREPGINTDGGNDKPDPLADKVNKPSLGEKIKAKLHKH